MDEQVFFYQNGHITLVNPDPRKSPRGQFKAALGAARRAKPLETDQWPERYPRKEWALSRRSGIMTEPYFETSVLFSNGTFDRRSDLGENRQTDRDPGHPPKEFFFLASAEAVPERGFLAGWFLEGYNLAVPDEPAAAGYSDGGRFTRANLILPADGLPVAFKKFHYSCFGVGTVEEVSLEISKACSVYLAAGWSEKDVLERVAEPALEAITHSGTAYGYAVVVGTVLVPRGALGEVGEGGVLPVPLAMNLSFDEHEELHCSLCCSVKKIDGAMLMSLGDGAPYPLVLSAVVEGLNDEVEDLAPFGKEFLEDFRALLAEVEAPGGEVPGGDEEIAQEIAKSVLEGRCGPGAAPGTNGLCWTQFSTPAFVQAARHDGPRPGKIAGRVREILLLAAAVKAVRPGDAPPYQAYLEWCGGEGA